MSYKVGDRVVITKEISNAIKAFQPGEILTIYNIGSRGPDLIHRNGDKICETGLSMDCYELLLDNLDTPPEETEVEEFYLRIKDLDLPKETKLIFRKALTESFIKGLKYKNKR